MIKWVTKVESASDVWRGINKGDCIELRKTFSKHPNFSQMLITITGDDVVMSMNGKAPMSVEDIAEIGEVVKEAKNKLGGGKRFVWLNVATGEFSNSWGEDEHKGLTQEDLDTAKTNGWKLIEYKCLNDGDFSFLNLMSLK